ncbi:hypothetical protein M569_12856 [Genlisea aurea]|uniref:Dof zinc finger protein n=1 Tax=Genlisea aurea TaxID=192259 RepID=S8DQA7_9LAMI|nr:hypothetical protein M569_12856 [Genlisea aurea]
MERRLRPQHDQALKCPRCESTHTKFCYYNNYSLSQPRYFCKTCRRYWTKGGTLRNIPVGGGCRKNAKKSAAAAAGKKPAADFPNSAASSASSSPLILNSPDAFSTFPLTIFTADQTDFSDLQLGFSDQLQFGSLNAAGLFPPAAANGYYLDNPVAADGFSGDGMVAGFDKFPVNYHGGDVKPILSLEWHENHHHHNQHQQQVCNSGGYGNIGSWTGFMNAFGSSSTNPLV